jgi:DNA polymerase-4
MPMAQALRLCPAAVRVSVPGKAIHQKSRDIRRVLERFTPIVEGASIDEWYLDMTGTETLYHGESLTATARRIQQAVLGDTRVAVSIGGGTSRLVAKLAAKRAKPHHPKGTRGVCVIPPGGEAAFLAELQLGDIPGVGPKLQQRLAARGLRSVIDALEYDEAALAAWLGERTGPWLYRRMRGISSAVVSRHRDPKSMSRETTFATDLYEDADLERELLRLATRVASDLRSKGLKTRTISIKFRQPDFTTRQASRTLPRPVDADEPIVSTARALLHKLRTRHPTGARLFGVALSGLDRPESGSAAPQLSLFDPASIDAVETEQDRRLARTVDDVNVRFGRGHLVRGTEVTPPKRRR